MPISPPTKITVPFATSGLKNSIPGTSNNVTGNAGYDQGFPPINMTPTTGGGIPPFGQDFNGVFFDITSALQFLEAGGSFPYDSVFATAVGGYPIGALVSRTDSSGLWRNTVANNTTNPETFGAGWQPEDAGASSIAMSNANVTLTALQAARSIIVITGTLTANVQLIFPLYQKQWLIVNNASGAFTVTAKTSVGSGVAISTGSIQSAYGDGTNIVASSPTSATKVTTITASGTYTPTPGMKAVFVQVQGGGGGGGGAQGAGTGASSGAGGSAGGYSEGYFTAAQIGASQTVTIGAAGLGGVGVNSGTAGTATSFGALLTATGGSFGNASNNSTGVGRGALPDTAGGGSGNTQVGQNGGIGMIIGTANGSIGGDGGSSRLGCGGRGRNENSTGLTGTGFGSGGAGGAGGTVTQNGGPGRQGEIILTEYF